MLKIAECLGIVYKSLWRHSTQTLQCKSEHSAWKMNFKTLKIAKQSIAFCKCEMLSIKIYIIFLISKYNNNNVTGLQKNWFLINLAPGILICYVQISEMILLNYFFPHNLVSDIIRKITFIKF